MSAVLWIADAVTIGLGLNPVDVWLFLAGLACHVVAVLTLVLWWTRRRRPSERILCTVAAVPANVLATMMIQGLVGLMKPDHPSWVWGERQDATRVGDARSVRVG